MPNISRRGLMLIVSAPSGTGKTTLSNLLIQRDPHIRISVSFTTRKPRQNEIDGEDYHFVSERTFDKMVRNNEFLEWAVVLGNSYGTPLLTVENYLYNGEDVLFDIDWQGYQQLVKGAREDIASVFILPPSRKELVDRLVSRNQDDNQVIKERMEQLNSEIIHWDSYDYVIINKNLEETLHKLESILKAERLRKARRTGLSKFVDNLRNDNN